MPHSTSSKGTESSSTFVPLTGSDVLVYPTYMKITHKAAKVLSLKIAAAPRLGVTLYGVVQSRSRGTRLNHQVVKKGRTWKCSCEHNLFRGAVCEHIRAMRKKLEQRKAA